MTFLIGLLTFVLVLNCLLLMLLVLIQLPKKEAGAGVAFGAGTTDALFGAGSGNALTKMTKYAASVFVALSLTLAFANAHRAKLNNQGLEQELLKKANAPAPALQGIAATNLSSIPAASTNAQAATNTLQSTNAAPNAATNTPANTATNPPTGALTTPSSAQPAATTPNATATPDSPAAAPK